jgi:hypothetical protein
MRFIVERRQGPRTPGTGHGQKMMVHKDTYTYIHTHTYTHVPNTPHIPRTVIQKRDSSWAGWIGGGRGRGGFGGCRGGGHYTDILMMKIAEV